MTVARHDYDGAPLDENDLASHPMEQFQDWIAHADHSGVPMANAATLATVDNAGQPSARVVLLKSIDNRGVVFFTDYRSRKGKELRQNPKASICVWWPELHRQVRLDGVCERVAGPESDAYFATRPRAANLSAMASTQSDVVASRAELEEKIARKSSEWLNRELLRPKHWGGLLLRPEAVEFWQGRPDRCHDRLLYRRAAGQPVWSIARLSP